MDIPIITIENPKCQDYPLLHCPICGQLIIGEEEYDLCKHVKFCEEYKLGHIEFLDKRLKRMVEYREERYDMNTLEALDNIGKEKSGVTFVIIQDFFSPSGFPEYDKVVIGFSSVRR